MFKALFNIIIDLMATIIQIVTYPLNLAISSAMPDLSDKIVEVTNVFNDVFGAISWGLGLLPNSVIITLLFIITIEIAKHTIFLSTHTLIKVWNIFQKVKFW